jgi:hypothetical protein
MKSTNVGVGFMQDADEFISYLKLQDRPDLITKSELLQFARDCGVPVSNRQLITYVAENLMPKSARIGSAGAYPRIVGDFLVWISRSRRQGVSIEAIKQLAPLWRHLQEKVKEGVIDLQEFEVLARDCVRLPDAALAVLFVLDSCLTCTLCGRPTEGIKLVQKDGVVRMHNSEQPATLGFVVADQDENGRVFRVASTSRVLPVYAEGSEPSTLILGIPNGVDLPASSPACVVGEAPPSERARAQPKGGGRERRRA